MSTSVSSESVLNLDIPCLFPPRQPLTGHLVALLPLQPDHADGLFQTIGGDDNGHLYDFLGYGPFTELEGFRDHIKAMAATNDPQMYAILDKKTQRLVGHMSYLRIDVPNRVIEIGHILYAPILQKSTQATEAFYLLAANAFELGYRRLEWKCNAQNAGSRRAALRLGHTFEGIFRQHMIVKGRNRDSAWFSILDHEWPNRKEAFESWMDPSNFDDEGRQIRTLESFRTGS
jgi:RimJ/RimL family protein N-acetyltransferase